VSHAPLLLAALWAVAQTPSPPDSPAAAAANVDVNVEANVDADGDGFIDATQTPSSTVSASSGPVATGASTTPIPAPGTSAPPTPPPEGPTSSSPGGDVPPAPAAPLPRPEFPPPSPEQRGVILPLPSSSSSAAAPGGTLSDYVLWYSADYAGLALAGGLYASGILEEVVPAPAVIGPHFDLDKPDLAVLFDRRLDDVIGRPLVREKVSTTAVAVGATAVLAGVAAVDVLAGSDLHRTHALVVGGAEALLGTVVLTEALKLSFGRLRPDFRERWLRAACEGHVKAPDGLDCSGVDDGFVVSRAEVIDGMKSFPSGHTSTSFAVLAFSSLALGSRFVWADDAPAWAAPVAALAIGGIAAGAGFTAASRLSDGRHHAEDVATGAALGSAIGVSTWLLHFDGRGRARTRWPVQVVPTATTSAAGTIPGLTITGSFG
jgi:diacylglycerol diphosphate phosphatase/phosphatidate phosphatase